MNLFYVSFFKNKTLAYLFIITLLICFTTNNSSAQIIPTAGATECFVAGNGGVFLDTGGSTIVGDNDLPGEYINCNCSTVTTLCSPDGSAITMDFDSFTVFSTFDYLSIYDGDNTMGTLLYDNSAGGINGGDQTLAEMLASNGSTTFVGTTGCITIDFFATGVVSDPGWYTNITVASGATHPGDNLECGTNLSCLAPPNIQVINITNNAADITWMTSDSASSYNIEYGLAGFTLGSGTLTNTTDTFLNLTGLTQNTTYEFYVQSDCDTSGMSNLAGPFSFTTLLSCPAPEDVVVSNVGPDTVVISWSPSFAAQSYNVEYGLQGFTLGTGVVTNTTNTSITLTGLNPNTIYEFYVDSDCGNEVSNNSTVNTFTTTFLNPCDYTLNLFDSFGDGWNGADLIVTIGCISTEYTFTTGDFATFTVNAGSNLPLTFTYVPGTFENEVSYEIVDPDGNIIYSDGPFPTTGVVLETFACPTCPGPTDFVETPTGDGVNLSWSPSNTTGFYEIEYGPVGFTPGTGTVITTSNTFVSISGLDELTSYDYYGKFICDNGDESGLPCAKTFTTIRLDDVGIVAINSPNSGCGLSSAEQVIVTMQNFGSNPQSLVPFKYSVNGIEVPINIPLDGYYTNVIGYDSLEVLDFMATYDFSAPGEYEIAAWTELDGDSNISNDTAYFTLLTIPTISDFPYHENFEDGPGGWRVDTDSSTMNATWEFGQPNGVDISTAASGINAWVTNLAGNYNSNETSYIVSSCFDLSSLTVDPEVSFSLIYDTQFNDGAWLDMSTDGGVTWSKVGAIGNGVNWYNDSYPAFGDVWEGGTGGWIFVKNTLTGAAGSSSVRLRFGFTTSAFTVAEGVGVDDISIYNPMDNDLLGLQVLNTSMEECGAPDDQLSLTIVNNGTSPQSGFDVGYQINNDPPVIENVGGLTVPANGGSEVYTFNATFNSTTVDVKNITAWTSLPGELNVFNDTTTAVLSFFRTLPFSEDFEGGVLPNGWDTDEFNPITQFHNNISFVAFDNLWSADPSFELITPVIGPVSAGDSLFFDYRIVDFVGGGANATTLGAGNMCEIQISTDCGASYNTTFTIDQSNHVSSNMLATIGVDLSNFAGEAIKIKFLGTWASGDYYLDIDNINIFQCTTLDLATNTTIESFPGAGDGTASISASANTGPFTYLWDANANNATTAQLTGLATGVYMVTVTDKFGCTETTEVTVDVGVNTEDLENTIQSIKLYPNPTNEIATLDMTFSKSIDVQIQVINTIGQVLHEVHLEKTSEQKVELDLRDFPDGMYFVRIKVDNQMTVKKLMKSRP